MAPTRLYALKDTRKQIWNQALATASFRRRRSSTHSSGSPFFTIPKHLLQEMHLAGSPSPLCQRATKPGSRMKGRHIEIRSASPLSTMLFAISRLRIPPTTITGTVTTRLTAAALSKVCLLWVAFSHYPYRRATSPADTSTDFYGIDALVHHLPCCL